MGSLYIFIIRYQLFI